METLQSKKDLLASYRHILSNDKNILEFHLQNWINDQRMTQYLALSARFKKLAQKGGLMCKIDMSEYHVPNEDEIQVLREYFEKRCKILEDEIAELGGTPVILSNEPTASADSQI